MPSADIILEFVNSHWKNLPKRPELDPNENNIAVAILDLLHSFETGDMTVTMESTYFADGDERDQNYDPSDDVCNEDIYDTIPANPNMVEFGGVPVEKAIVRRAVEYFGSRKGFHNNGQRNRPSEIKETRRQMLKVVTDNLGEEVNKLLETGCIFHDTTIRFMVARIIKKKNLDLHLKVSKQWIDDFKKSNRISSRKITKFVTVKNHRNKNTLIQKGKEYVDLVNLQFGKYANSEVFSADQSGIQLELHTGRTLAQVGSKTVEVTVQSAASTTHSYTIMPVLSAEGKFHEKLFVVLQEISGKFPAKGHYQADNLEVTCHTSHIMTKKLMLDFFKDVYFDSSMPTNTLLLVDSWSSWKDKSAIDSVTPPSHSCETMIIPPGCTGNIQVLDVGIFNGFKRVIKYITGQLQFDRPDYKINRRDETLKMLSAVYRQICHPKLQPWAQYAWSASGYNIVRPPGFSTPAELLFPNNVAADCSSTGCNETSFIKCLYCDNLLCIDHFLVKEVHDC
uniref:HTH CENPB-type domain-containing protein n=1 Tax=Caenorhabditis japonica TaxID=281687 RepID=A0A8R1HRE9_CAEJA